MHTLPECVNGVEGVKEIKGREDEEVRSKNSLQKYRECLKEWRMLARKIERLDGEIRIREGESTEPAHSLRRERTDFKAKKAKLAQTPFFNTTFEECLKGDEDLLRGWVEIDHREKSLSGVSLQGKEQGEVAAVFLLEKEYSISDLLQSSGFAEEHITLAQIESAVAALRNTDFPAIIGFPKALGDIATLTRLKIRELLIGISDIRKISSKDIESMVG